MNERHVIDTINEKVRSVPITDKPNLSLTERYPYWYIGVTNYPNERKAWHASKEADVKHWRSWPADTKAIARYVEKYFWTVTCGGPTVAVRTPPTFTSTSFFPIDFPGIPASHACPDPMDCLRP